MTFTKNKLRDIRSDLERALASVGAHHGISFSMKSMIFSGETCDFKTTMVMNDVDGLEITPELLSLRQLHPTFENKVFEFRNKKYVVVGFSPRSKRYPFIARTPEGKFAKFTWDIVCDTK